MGKSQYSKYVLFLIIFSVSALALFAQNEMSSPKYELRGAWIATVLNIDWPSKPGLSVQQQKQEFIDILDKDKAIGINAIFMQVRPVGDAFYPSQYDPWSEYLSGKQGEAPNPFYDPLKFMIEQTHLRGMEFHAWINPYRMVFDVTKSSIAPNHITRLHPEWFVNYGKQKIFNPGLPQTVDYLVGVVKDIVHRYDIDGIHFDDYFYPYPTSQHFNDDAAYKKYGGGLSLADWRRANCDTAIKRVHDAIMQTNPMIKFGVSPFGIYKNISQDPDGSDTKGLTNYYDLYADILLWLKKGWIDYVAPQIYWPIGKPGVDYKVLLNWWANHTFGKQLYIGEGIYYVTENPNSAWSDRRELGRQIQLLRQNSQVNGMVFFSNTQLKNNLQGWSDSLTNHYFRKPALIPPMDWIDNHPANAPEIWIEINGSLMIQGALDEVSDREIVNKFVLYVSQDPGNLGQSPEQIIVGKNDGSIFSFFNLEHNLPRDCKKFYVAVSSVDRENNESELSNILRFEKSNSGTWIGYNGY